MAFCCHLPRFLSEKKHIVLLLFFITGVSDRHFAMCVTENAPATTVRPFIVNSECDLLIPPRYGVLNLWIFLVREFPEDGLVEREVVEIIIFVTPSPF